MTARERGMMRTKLLVGPGGAIMIIAGAFLVGIVAGSSFIHNSWGIFPGALWLLGLAMVEEVTPPDISPRHDIGHDKREVRP